MFEAFSYKTKRIVEVYDIEEDTDRDGDRRIRYYVHDKATGEWYRDYFYNFKNKSRVSDEKWRELKAAIRNLNRVIDTL